MPRKDGFCRWRAMLLAAFAALLRRLAAATARHARSPGRGQAMRRRSIRTRSTAASRSLSISRSTSRCCCATRRARRYRRWPKAGRDVRSAGVGIPPAPRRDVPRRHAVHRRGCGVLDRAGAAAGLRRSARCSAPIEQVIAVESHLVRDQARAGRRRCCRRNLTHAADHEQGVDREERRHQGAEAASCIARVHVPQRQRHRPVRAGQPRDRQAHGDAPQRCLLGQRAGVRSRSPS